MGLSDEQHRGGRAGRFVEVLPSPSAPLPGVRDLPRRKRSKALGFQDALTPGRVTENGDQIVVPDRSHERRGEVWIGVV